MNWPDNFEDIECVGFSESFLHILIRAWDRHEVNILPGAIRRTSTDLSWEFDFFHFRYRIDCEEGSEIRDDGRLWSITTPYRIERIAKLSHDKNGYLDVIEHYPIASPMIVQPKPPAYAGVWGSF
jgi:hypothetical protein